MSKTTATPDKAINTNRFRLAKGRYLVKRPRASGEPMWYLEQCVGGKQTRTCLWTTEYAKAYDLVMRTPVGAVPAVEAPAIVIPPAPGTPAVVTLGQKRNEYEDWYSPRHKDRGSRKALETVDCFVDFIGEDRDIKTLTQKDVQKWVDAGEFGRCEDTKDDTRVASTRINEFGRLRSFIRWVVKKQENRHLLDIEIVRGIELPPDDYTPSPAPERETVDAIIRAMGSHWLHDYAIILSETGMRAEEPLAIRGVDLKGDMLTIGPWQNPKYCRYTDGKWSPKSKWSIRKIRLNARALAVVKARVDKMLDKTAPIFLNERGMMYDVNHSTRIWRERLRVWDKKHGTDLKGWTPKDCGRHFFITEQANAGMRKDDLREYIGHSPKSITLEKHYKAIDGARRPAPPVLTGHPQTEKATG